MKFYILHNSYDQVSRELVSSIPKNSNEYVVIDWYGDEGARFSYNGPPASSFPSVAFEQEDGFYIVREASNWKEIDEAVAASLISDVGAKLSRCNKDEFVGGQRLEELEELVSKAPHYFKDKNQIEAKIRSTKERRDGKKDKKLDQGSNPKPNQR